jgi:Mg2+-importing ATPase
MASDKNMIRTSPQLTEASSKPGEGVLQMLGTTPAGLTEAEAADRIEKYGPNEVAYEKKHTWWHRLYTASRNPLVILLIVLAVLSFATGDVRAGTVMLLMVVLGLSLRFVQETKADNAAAKLKAMISVTATVVREGKPREVPLRLLVPGDIVTLSAGDMIPGDVRLMSAKDLFVIQATLTGESLPVEKTDAPDTREKVSPIERTNLCFLGTSVESGSATAAIVATGPQTYFGNVARSLAGQQPETAFERGIKRFTWLMIRFMVVMVPLVFLINGLTKHDWHQAFFFSLAVAVGLTPEMLPMIVSVCLSKGALAMSRTMSFAAVFAAINSMPFTSSERAVLLLPPLSWPVSDPVDVRRKLAVLVATWTPSFSMRTAIIDPAGAGALGSADFLHPVTTVMAARQSKNVIRSERWEKRIMEVVPRWGLRQNWQSTGYSEPM